MQSAGCRRDASSYCACTGTGRRVTGRPFLLHPAGDLHVPLQYCQTSMTMNGLEGTNKKRGAGPAVSELPRERDEGKHG